MTTTTPEGGDIRDVEWHLPGDAEAVTGYQPPRFGIATELVAPGAVDAQHVAAVLTFDGAIIGTVRARLADGGEPRFVASGVTVRSEAEPAWSLAHSRSTAIAASGARTFPGEPDAGTVASDVIYAELREDAYGWVRYAAEGSDLPTGLLPAFYAAVTEASERFDRPVVDGKLTGSARTW